MVCKQSVMFYKASIAIFISLTLLSCSENNRASSDIKNKENEADAIKKNGASYSNIVEKIDNKRLLIKLSHHINTSANEYFPVLSADEKTMYFSAMDRSGYFDFKVDLVDLNKVSEDFRKVVDFKAV